MSAQGATLGRGTIRVPIRPLAVLVIVAVSAAIGLTIIENAQRNQAVTSIQETEGYWASTVGHPVLRGRGGLAPAINPAAVANSLAAVREQGAFAYHAPGRAHEVSVGAAVTGTTYISGLENPGAVTGTDATFTPKAGGQRPISVAGKPCPQCR